MKSLVALTALLCALSAHAATYGSYTVTFTNTTANGDSVTVSGSTARFTNAPLNSTAWIQLGDSNVSATNFLTWLGRNKSSLTFSLSSSNVVTLSGIGLTATISGPFGEIATNNVTSTNAIALIPWDNHFATNRTNNADEFIYGLNKYVLTNAFSQTAQAMTNFVNRTNAQAVTHKVFGLSHFSGGAVSNAVLTNIPLLHATNAELRSAIVRAGTLSNVTLINLAAASGTIGSLTNGSINGTMVSNSPAGIFTNLVAYSGFLSGLTGSGLGITNLQAYDYIRLDGASASPYILLNNTFAIGYDTTGSGAFYIQNVDSGDTMLRMEYGGNNVFTAPTIISNHLTTVSNFTASSIDIQTGFRITNGVTSGTNKVDARLDFTSRANTALANGNNSGIVLGSNVYVRLSGASAAFTNAGFVAEQDGSFHILQIENPANNMTLLDASGLEATTANRLLLSGASGGQLNFTNNPVMLPVIYDGTASRWRIINGMFFR